MKKDLVIWALVSTLGIWAALALMKPDADNEAFNQSKIKIVVAEDGLNFKKYAAGDRHVFFIIGKSLFCLAAEEKKIYEYPNIEAFRSLCPEHQIILNKILADNKAS